MNQTGAAAYTGMIHAKEEEEKLTVCMERLRFGEIIRKVRKYWEIKKKEKKEE